MAEFREFPEDFYWGAATSSHQIEGENQNNWTRWEKNNAEELASTAKQRIESRKDKGRPAPEWKDIKEQASDPENYISGKATNHIEKFSEDFQIASDLNMNAYRFSIEWSRIEPKKGEIDQDALDFYHSILDELEKHGIEPFVTLHHFTNPKWFSERGGWASRKASRHWENYLETIVREFGDRIDNWITVNEPNVYAFNSFLIGRWPPQSRSPAKYFRVLKNMAAFHRSFYRKVNEADLDARVGISNGCIYFDPSDGYLNHLISRYVREHWNHGIIQDVLPELDFIGLNFYKRRKIDHGMFENGFDRTSDLGWELYPRGVYEVLKELEQYNLPVIITENGVADSEDEERERYLREVLKHCHRAIEDGVNLEGYLHWSLLDNFEWDSGRWPRFGLVEVDYSNYERNCRESAEAYAQIISQNGLETPE